jgi:hypothetical protein
VPFVSRWFRVYIGHYCFLRNKVVIFVGDVDIEVREISQNIVHVLNVVRVSVGNVGDSEGKGRKRDGKTKRHTMPSMILSER